MASYLTFDLGTTALKTALVSDQGEVLALSSQEYQFRAARPGWAEMAPDTYWQALLAGAREVLDAAAGQEVLAIGFSSQGQTFVPLDPKGRPLSDAIVWVDNRAQGIAEGLVDQGLSADHFQQLTGYPGIPAALTVFKLAWLAHHAPGVHSAWKFPQLPDYLIWRLTGEFMTDYVIGQMSGLMDKQTKQWSPELLAIAGVTSGQLSAIAEPGRLAGKLLNEPARLLGVPEGTPVCLGCNDQLAGALGVGNVEAGLVSETTGTALAGIVTLAEPLEGAPVYLGNHAVPGLSYLMPYAQVSGVLLSWLREWSRPSITIQELLAQAEAVPAGSEGLLVLPGFEGVTLPKPIPRARGALLGLNLAHGRGHIARAMVEATAYLLKDCLLPVTESGVSVSEVRSLGRAAASGFWLQVKADVLGVPVEQPVCPSAASVGAAMLAATGIGQFASLKEASLAWHRPARRFVPRALEVDRYARYYQNYRASCELLYASGVGLWEGQE